MMKRLASLLCVPVTLAVVGCASHDGIQGVSSHDAARLNASRSQFNSANDPPLTADTHFAAAQLAENEHVNDQAIKQYKEALKIDPKHLASLYRLGVLYTQLKEYPQAIETWDKYVKATNESPSAYSNLGFCQEMAGQPNDAEAAYKKGIEKDPRNLPCRTNYGLMLARHQHVQEAIRMWQPVLSDAEIHYNLASVYELDGRKQEAKAEYQRALAVDPKFLDAKSRLATLE